MILSIILLILIILIIAILILFSYDILLPSIHIDKNKDDDPLLPSKNKVYSIPEYNKFEKNNLRAYVINHKIDSPLKPTQFNEQYTCFMMHNKFGKSIDYKNACLGLGDCIKTCPQQAIILEDGKALVTDNCCGCGRCIEICPQKIIKLIPETTKSIEVLTADDKLSVKISDENQYKEKVEWKKKKDFKIWSNCYRLINSLFKK